LTFLFFPNNKDTKIKTKGNTMIQKLKKEYIPMYTLGGITIFSMIYYALKDLYEVIL